MIVQYLFESSNLNIDLTMNYVMIVSNIKSKIKVHINLVLNLCVTIVMVNGNSGCEIYLEIIFNDRI